MNFLYKNIVWHSNRVIKKIVVNTFYTETDIPLIPQVHLHGAKLKGLLF